MSNFKSEFYKHSYSSGGPFVLGLSLFIWALYSNQNGLYILGAVTGMVLSVIAFLFVMGWVSRKLQIALSAVFLIAAIWIGSLVYGSVNDVIKFRAEKASIEKLVVQRLKDIRTAEIAFRDARGVYTNNLDTLQEFIKHGVIPEVKKIGQKPDTLTEVEALEMGLIVRDTVMEPALYRFTSEEALNQKRDANFDLDAFIYVPPSDEHKFLLKAGVITSGGRDVPVFQAKDPFPFSKPDHPNTDTLWVGSMTKSSTSGNWKGE